MVLAMCPYCEEELENDGMWEFYCPNPECKKEYKLEEVDMGTVDSEHYEIEEKVVKS